ncbi:MAG: hypothetical protein AB7U85_04980 [Alphaproteobacteria bacterium]
MIQGYTTKNASIVRFFEIKNLDTIASQDEEMVIIEDRAEFELIRNTYFQQEKYNNHDIQALSDRQQEYRELNATLLGLVQIGEATQEEYENACNAIKTTYPKLEEMTLEQKQTMYPLLNLT